MRGPIPSGETLREDLDALGISPAELARRIGRLRTASREIVGGRRSNTRDRALRVGRFFGTSGEFSLNLQRLYPLRRAEQRGGADVARLQTVDADRNPRTNGLNRHGSFDDPTR